MLQIDEILPLYPDDISRQLMLTQALEYVQADLRALHHAIKCSDHEGALQQVHRAKGTASFLGGDQPGLKFFDDLTTVLKQIQKRCVTKLPSKPMKENLLPSETVLRGTPVQDSELIASALRPVEQTLRTIEASLQQSLAAIEKNSLQQ